MEGPQLRIVASNAEARASVGHRSGLLGRPVRDVVPELAGQHLVELLDDAYAGRPARGWEQRILADLDGDGQPEERYYAFDLLPWRTAAGTIRGVIMYGVNVTEARRTAAAVAAETAHERRRQAANVVLTLQRGLLPAGVPLLPELSLAAHYLVAGDELAAGGDWFDAVALADGRVALMVGDVVGHGAAASAAMGQLRAVALGALHSGAGLAGTAAQLDAFAARGDGTRTATACLAMLDPGQGRLEVISYAHPAPLLLGAAGDGRFLPLRPARPLGTGSPPAQVHVTDLRHGESLLLYTDGLVERDGRSLADGMAALAAVAGAVVRDAGQPEQLCALTIERLSLAEGYGDDITVLAVHRRAEPAAPLALELPAEPAAVPLVRKAVSAWLRGLDASPGDVNALIHAVGEAASNAVEHAYGPTESGTLTVEAVLTSQGDARLTISDRGRWRWPPTGTTDRGRGVALMRGLVHRVDIQPSNSGTTVILGQPLRRPARVWMASPTAPALAPAAGSDRLAVLLHLEADRRVLHVSGPIDLTTVDRLRVRILNASKAGTPLVLDLSGVTFLASAGVRLLHDLAGVGAVQVTAASDAPVQAVLSLTGI
jgi:anti-anti-sigma factor